MTLSRRFRSCETCTSPGVPCTVGSRSSAASMSLRSLATLAPALTSSGRVLPSCWSSSAPSTCAGSMNWWSRPTARDWASARADWNRLVSLSIRIGAQIGASAANLQGDQSGFRGPSRHAFGRYLFGISVPYGPCRRIDADLGVLDVRRRPRGRPWTRSSPGSRISVLPAIFVFAAVAVDDDDAAVLRRSPTRRICPRRVSDTRPPPSPRARLRSGA